MKTDVITIHSDTKGLDTALLEAERFAGYHRLTDTDTLHIRLLTEEAVSLIHGIIEEFYANFWIESEKIGDDLLCRIVVSAQTEVSAVQEEKLLSTASSGRNEDAKGVLGMIRQLFRHIVQSDGTGDDLDWQNDNPWYGMGTQDSRTQYRVASMAMGWSLQAYRQSAQEHTGDRYDRIMDELERSIIANLADDVKVGISSGRAQVTIEKRAAVKE